jgi:hypothetical protein
MGPFEMVLGIVLLITVGKVLQSRFRHQAARGDDAEAAQLRDELRRLKERVQVLERVVTDNEGSLRLDREIERLPDDDRV